MRTWTICGLLTAWICAAQTQSANPDNPAEIEARLLRDLRGINEDARALAPSLTLTQIASGNQASRPADATVSVTQLQHKPPKEARQRLARGARLAQAGHHAQAAAEFEQAISRDPHYANARNRLGVEYALLGRYPEAEAELRRSISLDPTSWRAHYDLAVTLFREGDLAGAEENVRHALERSSASAEPHVLLGLLLWHRAETRAEGLNHLRYAAHTMPQAHELLIELQKNESVPSTP